MRINNNIPAINTHRQYTNNVAQTQKSLEKLSSGYRINRAGDDAAGLAISEKMRAQIRGLNMASKNSQDAISLIQTAEGALQETHNILQRMRELAVQSATDTNVGANSQADYWVAKTANGDSMSDPAVFTDRKALNLEFQQLIAEIDDIATRTTFNERKVIDGTFDPNLTVGGTGGGQITLNGMQTYTVGGGSGGVYFYVHSGANNMDGTWFKIKAMTSWALGLHQDTTVGATALGWGGASAVSGSASAYAIGHGWYLDIETRATATAAIKIVNSALNVVSLQRAELGALQNRFEHKITNLDTSAENLAASESRIRDVDMAKIGRAHV